MRPSFENLSAEARELFLKLIIATNPIEAVSFETVISDASGLEISSMEATTPMPTTPRMSRPKHSTTKEKQKKPMSVGHSPRKNPRCNRRSKKINNRRKWLT